jgi:type IV pilus assembly protein PilB
MLKELGCEEDKQIRLSRGKGCSDCYDSGFKGRTGIYELFEMDPGLQSLILTNPTIDILQEHLRKNGHGTLNSLGYKKVLERITIIEEVKRVTSVERV